MERALDAADVPSRLVVLHHTHDDASQLLCKYVRVLRHRETVIDATVRWLGGYLNGTQATPTGTVCH